MKYPTIMIGTMVKNSERWLPRYFRVVESLDYPKDKIRIVFIYGDSFDKTLELLKDFKKKTKYKVEVYKEQYDQSLQYGAQAAAIIYKDWQELLTEDYFLLLDSDVVEVPSNLLQELIKIDADIVAPYPWSEGHRHFYDSWIFRINNKRFHPTDPPGYGLKYPIKVDSVGTCFLAKKEVFKTTPILNPYPNLTFCNNARKRGYTVVACPFLEIFHIDLEKMGIYHNPLPPSFGGYPDKGFLTSNYKVERYFTKEEIKEKYFKEEQEVLKDILGSEKNDT